MSHFRPVALQHASRLLNHGPTILITSQHPQTQRRNVMAAAWSTPVEFTPPRVAIVVDKSAWSRELIETSGAFGICVPAAAYADLTYAVGNTTGRERDKFSEYRIQAINGPELGVPLLEESCVAWLECRLLPATEAQQNYDTLFGEVVAAAADSRVFYDGRWHFSAENRALHTLHHLGGGEFVTVANGFSATLPEAH
ncbi:flavin reductase family protein [Candidatus Pantoea deserta]|uniref:Flavin reductase family protein n=1 Tax=Candidatus Pantoea deserta TaxID=1869313 RepID=A0A3N4NQV5_9GAMM|nr:flavin reductase family protein [Pantoea deserta]RPD96858.1 flavin reductase family protein [Pantoea deserta]